MVRGVQHKYCIDENLFVELAGNMVADLSIMSICRVQHVLYCIYYNLVRRANKPLPCKVILLVVDAPPQVDGFRLTDWMLALAEARADRDRAKAYLSYSPTTQGICKRCKVDLRRYNHYVW